MAQLEKWFARLLEVIACGLFGLLTLLVVAAVVARYVLNSSIIWYDEVASVLLAWITYYGAAYAALQRRHLGFSSLVLQFGQRARAVSFVCAELVVYATFISLAYASTYVLKVMVGETLVALRWVPLTFTQSVVPVGCVLFVFSQVLSTGRAWRRLRSGRSSEDEEIAEELGKPWT